MGKPEATIAVGELVAAFGQQNINEDRVNSYVDNLCDIEASLLSKSVQEIIHHSKFFPAIAEIREAAARLGGLTPAFPPAATAIIRKADVRKDIYRRDGSYAYTERYWEWPEMNEATKLAIESALAQVGEPCDESGKEHFGWENGFQKVYQEEAQSISSKLLADLSMARLIEAPKAEITDGR
jgi:hypothetical protein